MLFQYPKKPIKCPKRLSIVWIIAFLCFFIYNASMIRSEMKNNEGVLQPSTILESIEISTHQQNSINVRSHKHEYCEIIYIISGEVEHVINNVAYTHSVGDCIILPTNSTHSIKNSNNSLWRDIMVSAELFVKILDLFPNNDVSNKEFTHLYLNKFKLTELESIANRFTTENNLIKKRCLGIEMILEILCSHSSNINDNYDTLPPLVKKICSNLNKESFVKGGITKILDDLQYSNSYVCHIFRKYMGIPLSEYIKNIRLDHIVYYLINTDYSLREIGDRVGIESLSYLNRLFKKTYSISPIKYRNLHSKKGNGNK